MIQRFITRLELPKSSTVKIKSVKKLLSHHEQLYLELYHTIRSFSQKETEEIIKSIIKNGFYSSIYGNKGYGVYLSSHSAYGYKWAGYGSGMLVCHVKINESHKIKRFISEIPPGYEYVVDPSIIVPAYFIEYEVIGKYKGIIWRELGEFGCNTCDKEKRRCDCPLEPAIIDDNNVTRLQ